MEITQEFKIAAFTSYYGSNYENGNLTTCNGNSLPINMDTLYRIVFDIINANPKLILTPLEDISEEDAIKVCELLINQSIYQLGKLELIRKRIDDDHNWTKLYIIYHAGNKWQIEYRGNDWMGWTKDSGIAKILYNHTDVADFLRSKSYNLPFRGIDLVEAGIATLKQKEV